MVEGFVLVAGVEDYEALGSDADAALNDSQDVDEQALRLELLYLHLLRLLLGGLELRLPTAEDLCLELVEPRTGDLLANDLLVLPFLAEVQPEGRSEAFLPGVLSLELLAPRVLRLFEHWLNEALAVVLGD